MGKNHSLEVLSLNSLIMQDNAPPDITQSLLLPTLRKHLLKTSNKWKCPQPLQIFGQYKFF